MRGDGVFVYVTVGFLVGLAYAMKDGEPGLIVVGIALWPAMLITTLIRNCRVFWRIKP